MMKTAGILLGGAALLMLSACMQKDPDPVGPGGTGTEVGKAEIVLPALPAGFLQKAAASRELEPYFILTISGSGMAPRKHAWPLGTAGGTAVTVENIPVGQRLFTGEIEAGGSIVYADSAWTAIESGRTALVRLKLARTTGNARVCVEIEGLPPPTGCGLRDSVPDVSGCWHFSDVMDDVNGPPVLRILQRDSLLEGVVTWRGGGWLDTARGRVTSAGNVSFGQGGGDFYFSGHYDRVNHALAGKFYRYAGTPPPREVMLLRTTCGPVDPPSDSLMTCHEVAQSLDGKSATGRFTLLRRDMALFGHFLWNGHAGMPVEGKAAPVNGNLGLYLYGNLPRSMARDPNVSDQAHYKAQVAPDGSLQFGTINGMDGSLQRGVWKGYAVPCTPKDRETIRYVHRI